MGSLVQDVKFGLRMLTKNPGFTAVAMITLAVGIGANTAIFSMVNAILLQPLPYPNPQSLVLLRVTEPSGPGNLYPVSGPDFIDWVKQNKVFESMAAGTGAGTTLTGLAGNAQPMQLQGFEVSPQIFSLLGVKPLIGRTFRQDETQTGRDQVVVLSYGLWQQAFGGKRSIVGKTITLNGKAYDVAGVMPRALEFPQFYGTKPEFWIPLNFQQPSYRKYRGNHWLWVMARMKSGITIANAQADMATVSHNLARQYPHDDTGVNAKVLNLHDQFVKTVRPALLVLFAAVGFLLLIACANIANLLLAKAIVRRREIAIRLAVGSGRGRLVRQLLTESVLLFLLGGVAGLIVGWAALRVLLYAAPAGYVPGMVHVRLGAGVFAFTFLAAFLTGIFAGLVPAIQTSKPDLHNALKEGGRALSVAHRRSRGVLTAAEIALAMVMLIGAGLAIKSLVRLLGVEPGFDAHNVLKARIALPDVRYPKDPQITAFYRQLLDRVRALPGVVSASVAEQLPLQGGSNGVVYIEGQPLPKDMWSSPLVEWCTVMPDYFRTLRIPLLRGRDFSAQDGPKSPEVAIINQTMAHRFWPNQNAVGKRVAHDYQKPTWITVVGVVGDVREYGLSDPVVPEAYFPESQGADSYLNIVIRTSTPPLSETPALRAVVHSLDSELAVFKVETLDQIMSQSSQQQQFMALLLGLFAAAALVLAAVGIYGVISYSVAQRTHEIGIRIALGAQRRDVLCQVLGEGATLALAGAGAGLAAAFGLTRLMTSLLYGVKPVDLPTFIVVPLVLIGVALLACYIPGRRAAKVDPMVALRDE
ncbi:MAG TPA: ABC transporter permease [Terriglobia bacterium]|nr:ABC transporter permease [Terriglobia bacterium]